MSSTETPQDAPVVLEQIAVGSKLYKLRPPTRAPGGRIILGPDYIRVGWVTYKLNPDNQTATLRVM